MTDVEKVRKKLAQMAGFRNVLVHGYEEVDLGVVRRILDRRLDDLTAYTTAMRKRLG